jgi:hypothetical protein
MVSVKSSGFVALDATPLARCTGQESTDFLPAIGWCADRLAVRLLHAAHQSIRVAPIYHGLRILATRIFASVCSFLVLPSVQVMGLSPNGGGLSLLSTAHVIALESNIFYNNTAGNGGGAYVLGVTSSTMAVDNCTCVDS